MLTIHLPEELEQELLSLTNDKQAFIIDAIRIKIDLIKKVKSTDQVAKEYGDFEKSKPQVEHFKNIGLENWGDY